VPPRPATRRDRRSPEERRALLLEAAIGAIAAKGFDGVTVRDVAERAQVSSGLLHHYFESFPALLAAAFAAFADAELQRVTTEAAQWPRPLERLDRLATLYAPAGPEPEWRLWLSAWGAAPRQEALRQTAQAYHVMWIDHFAEVLTEGAATGAFTCPDPRISARRITTLIDGLATQIVGLETTTAQDAATDIAGILATETGLPPDAFPSVAALGRGSG
jgi:AcrR family transcriptional regulator